MIEDHIQAYTHNVSSKIVMKSVSEKYHRTSRLVTVFKTKI